MMAEYKEIKEQFVSGHEGTSVFEIACVVSVAPLSVLLRNVILSWLYRGQSPGPLMKLFWDFAFLILPVLTAFTVLSDNLEGIFSAMGFMVGAILMFGSDNGTADTKTNTLRTIGSVKMHEKQPFITWFRSYVNIATAISILAVDFRIYPRRFAKAETFGTGLMDVGVGAFVISNAIVSPEARGKSIQASTLNLRFKSIWKSIMSTLPLWILGIGRLLTVKAADYQEHASEYGVHWNFFFTLAAVRVGSTIFLSFVSPKWSGCLSLLIAVTYQFFLSGLGMETFVLHGSDSLGSRIGLLNANREGIFSCFGYLAIYFAGLELGKYLFRPRTKYSEWFRAFWVLVILDLIFFALLHLCEMYIEPTSRRMANLPYVIWMLAYNLQLIPFFLLVDLILIPLNHINLLKAGPISTPFCLMEAINKNGLFYFLLANILTGVINMSMKTIDVSDSKAYNILTVYMFVLSATATVFSLKNISLKFW